ncbi:thioesterase II family protein [Kitasatospora sp. NPDC006697]|uniref:thioesterase II family protein n=1 Tax=Kitasatospora sp. NPDC006697 TaxID=3364020 RepID=UPI00367D0B6E
MSIHTRSHSPERGAGLAVESPFLWRARRAEHTHQLVCFPQAGGGAGAFGDWPQQLPAGIEVLAVQLPGRQNRLLEDPATEAGPLVRTLIQALRPLLDGPFSFFGHSSGALLAYELAQALQARGGPAPAHLFFSGQASPIPFRDRPRLAGLSEQEFRAEVLRLGGFDEEVMQDEEALEALLPPVLADFALWEQHPISVTPRLAAPITALVGESDSRVPVEHMATWRDHTDAEFELKVYPGGHFYLFDQPVGTELLEFIAARLTA